MHIKLGASQKATYEKKINIKFGVLINKKKGENVTLIKEICKEYCDFL